MTIATGFRRYRHERWVYPIRRRRLFPSWDDPNTTANAILATGTGTAYDATVDTGEGQLSFRIRSDDSVALTSDTGWEAAQDTSVTMGILERFRIRFGIKAGASPVTDGYQIRVSVNSGAYTLIPNNTHHVGSGLGATNQVAIVPSDSYTNEVAITSASQFITSGTWVNGYGMEDNTTPSIALGAGNVTEIEWCIIVHKMSDDAEIADGTTLDFRVYYDDGTVLPAYPQTPRVTVANTPGNIGGTFHEMGGDVGPFVDGTDMYVLCERSESNNVPAVMKSSDNGVSWTEMDAANNPTTIDMEGGAAVLVSNELRIIHHPGDDTNLHYHSFRTSGHASADTWGTVDATIDSAVGAKISPYSDDSCDIVYRPTSGDYVIVYTGSAEGSFSTVWMRSGVPGTWDARFDVDTEASTHFGGAHLTIDADERVHVTYKDGTNGIVYHRSLDAVTTKGSDPLTSADLSARTAIHSDDETGNTIGRTRVTSYDSGGTWKVPVAYINDTGTKHARMNMMIESTGLGTERIASDVAVSDEQADHEGAWHLGLAVDGTDIYQFWINGVATGDAEEMFYAVSSDGAAFGTPVLFWDLNDLVPNDKTPAASFGNSPGWDALSAKIVTHGGGRVVAVLGSWSFGGSSLVYKELALPSPSLITPRFATRRHLLTR